MHFTPQNITTLGSQQLEFKFFTEFKQWKECEKMHTTYIRDDWVYHQVVNMYRNTFRSLLVSHVCLQLIDMVTRYTVVMVTTMDINGAHHQKPNRKTNDILSRMYVKVNWRKHVTVRYIPTHNGLKPHIWCAEIFTTYRQ